MSVVRWKPSARTTNPETLMTTELNSLADGSGAVTSTAVQNGATSDELDMFMDLELDVTFGTAPANRATVDVYIVRTVDEGTTYERYVTGASPWAPGNGYAGSFVLDDITTNDEYVLPNIQIPPYDFHLVVINNSNQAFPSSGSTIRGYFYSVQNA